MYIRPYHKSLAEDLHPDTVAIDPANPPTDHVVFRPFVGVAPLAYLPIFEHPERRKTDDGHAVEFIASRARPKLSVGWDLSYLEREDLTIVTLKRTLREQAGPAAPLRGRCRDPRSAERAQAPGARIARPVICPAAVLRRSAIPAWNSCTFQSGSARTTPACWSVPWSCDSAWPCGCCLVW